LALAGQRASDDGFALWVHTVAKRAESEAVRTGSVGLRLTLCEVSYLVNPRGSTSILERRPRLGSRFRGRRALIELLVLWHHTVKIAVCFQYGNLWALEYGVNTPVAYSGPGQRFQIVSVILRHVPSGFLCGGRGLWVHEPALALDLGTIEGASDAARVENFGCMEIVVGFGEPNCEFVLPLRPHRTSGYRAAAVRLQAVAAQAPASVSTASTPIPPQRLRPG
jgi:hypothetical protein